MPGTNEILKFGENASGSNVLTQAAYDADAQRLIGHQPGIARQELENKALLQVSVIASAVAQFIADNQANDVTDALTPSTIAGYLQTAMNAAGVTAAQFDNDTSLATTAFVQRALGNCRGLNSFNASAVLTAGDIGKLITFYGSTASQTLTFPAASAIPAGSGVWVVNQASVSVQVIRAGADTLNINTLAGVGSSTGLTLYPGDSIFFTSNGLDKWNAFGIASNNQFPSSLGASGYQKLPSGLIIQWGQTLCSSSATTPVTLPIAYPNSHLVAVASAGSANARFATAHTLSLGGFNTDMWTLAGARSAEYNLWISIGR